MKSLLPSLLLSCCLLTTVGAQAAPPTPSSAASAPMSDGVTQLLIERGLLPAGAAPLVQNMRDRASDLVLSAMNFLGVPYRRGGNSEEEGFDCSGFTRHVFENSLGLVLPRRADEQAKADGLQKVARDELKPGDLVFFNTLRRTFSHVGIYVGDGKFIHAPRTGQVVRVESMQDSYWARRFTGARRVPGTGDGT
ncbi:C40 family peptidase [Azohydromonas aeria]|uniref:C40 family peptidase n=1 Tax=Azohydromonas aeria TaxID=2590212 RepID=UPI0035BF1755